MRWKVPIIMLAVAIFCSGLAFAQQQYGTLTGTVKDEQGGVLPGATVTLTSPALIGGPRVQVTGVMGTYRFPNLPPGTYTAKFDIASQMDRYNFVKAGMELVYTHSKMDYRVYDIGSRFLNRTTRWDKTPIRAAIYIQDKLEWEGMIELRIKLPLLGPSRLIQLSRLQRRGVLEYWSCEVVFWSLNI